MATFKKFNQEPLYAYVQWVKNGFDTQIILHDPPELPEFTNILQVKPDQLAEE
jgi:hypothetical protein